MGHVWERAWPDIDRGAVFDTDTVKAEHLSRQRPGFSVYQNKAEDALAVGAASHLEVGIVDCDPYGEPWPTLEAFFTTERPRLPLIGVAVNDGLRQKLRLQGGWHVASMRGAVERFGNAAMHAKYLDVARWKMEQLAAIAGYRLQMWTGYYCGDKGDMTHYAAVLGMAPRRRRR